MSSRQAEQALLAPVQKPSQIKFVRAAQMSLFATVLSWPPLARVTFLKRKKHIGGSGAADRINFTVVLESSSSFPEKDWEVCVWHNINGGWEDFPLKKVLGSRTPVRLGRKSKSHYHQNTFAGQLPFPEERKHTCFTVKYRIDSDSPWQWVKEQFGTRDGEIVFDPPQLLKEKSHEGDQAKKLGDFIRNLNPELNVEKHMSDVLGTVLWSLKGKVAPAMNHKSGRASIPLGMPMDFVRNFSLVRIWSPWLAPRHGQEDFRLTEDAIVSAFLRKDGLSLVLLAVSGPSNALTVLQSDKSGVVISARNDEITESDVRVLAAVAPSFELAIATVMYEARKEARQLISSTPPVKGTVEPKGSDNADAQWMSTWYDGLAYCTWNSLGQNLTEEKILNALDSFKANGINIVSLIIDDNWQSLDNKGQSQFKRGWMRFEANEEGFPKGLKHTVDAIRKRNSNLKHIAVWHALMGYWGGISPDGDLAKKYKTKTVEKVDRVAGGSMLAIDPDDIKVLYDDFYSFLQSAGVDAVKTDAQFFLDALEDPTDRVRFTTAYQDAWSIASLRHFQAKAISCMSQAPQIIFHSQLQTTRPRFVLRNSDDFFPDVPTSHPWHIFCNAHNSLLTRHLNVVPDWDMFQTNHSYASFHAAARCLSGGPIYITDEPGKHDSSLVNQMSAMSVNGSSVILRPSVPGCAVDCYHNYNEGQILKIGSYTGQAFTGSGILGLFNISGEEIFSLISILDFPGITPDTENEYIVQAFTAGDMTVGPCDQSFLFSIYLELRGWEILTAYPVRKVLLGSAKRMIDIAVLGLTDKMTGVAAILSSDTSPTSNGRIRCTITLKALGVLGIYVSELDGKTVEKNFLVTLSGEAVPEKTVKLDYSRNLLLVDLLTAWKEMKIEPGWSNEVSVQVFMS